jgi:beta-lactamase regulating signal transducer with metallopeptidase domain
MQEFLTTYPFPSLLKASWQAAVLVLLVLAAQWAFGRRLSPRWRYGLWLLVVARLALPWTIPSSFSVFNFVSYPEAVAAATAVFSGVHASLSTVARDSSTALGTSSAPGHTVVAAPGDDRTPTLNGSVETPAATVSRFHLSLSYVLLAWAAGALALAVCLGITHYRLWRRVTLRRPLIDMRVMNLLEDCKQAMGVRVPVTLVETPAVGSPSLFGFLRPRLLLPVGLTRDFSQEELRYVFLHELSHIKRQDILTGWLMTALQILHWFNPLVWLAFHRMRLDRELACDALALSYAKEEENQPYGRTIIKLLESFGGSTWAPSMAGTVENKNQIKERISMIAKFRKTSHGLALAGVLFIGLGLITLTDAQTSGKSSAPEATGGPPPNIVATSPAVGATDVDPGLREITVTFDQDMGGGFSWTGGGPDFPPAPEGQKAQWRDKRTCVLPVKLEAGHYYRVGINSTTYRNFRSAAGVSAEPSAIYFTTQGASEELKAKAQLPMIVKVSPPNDAQDVSPGLTELRVTFNMPMGAGFSWCGDGPQFPIRPEGKRPFWTDGGKTCVLPVKLEPGVEYEIGLNSPLSKNFQSAGGVPLEPMLYSFKTSGKAAETAQAGNQSDEQQHLKKAEGGDKWAAFWLWDSYYHGNNGIKPEPAKADKWLHEFVQKVSVVRFEPVDDFTPASPQEFLQRIHQYAHTSSGKTEIGTGGFFRTTRQGDKLVGSFLSNYPDELKASLAKVPGLKVTSAEEITPEAFIKYEESPQESLPEGEEQKLKQAEGGDKWAVFWLWDSYYRGKNGIKPDPAKADKWLHEFVQKVWVVRFEPVDDFTPASPQEFLERVNHYAHTSSGRTDLGTGSFFRTTKQGDKLVGSFLCNYPDELKANLAKVPGLKVTSVEEITPEAFIKYEESRQESL